MHTNPVYHRNGNAPLLGIVHYQFGGICEVRILSPYSGFVLAERHEEGSETAEAATGNQAYRMLETCHQVCEKLQREHKEAKAAFIKLLETLESFNNKLPEDFERNRNELMKVFMNQFFRDVFESEELYRNVRDGIFSFLGNYFLKYGKCAELDLRTERSSEAPPPPFHELEAKLREYLDHSEEQRTELLALHILARKNTEYSWFLQQEFLTEKTKEHD